MAMTITCKAIIREGWHMTYKFILPCMGDLIGLGSPFLLLQGLILGCPFCASLSSSLFFSHTCFVLWVAVFFCPLLVGGPLCCLLVFLLPEKFSSPISPFHLGSALFLLLATSVFILVCMSSPVVVRSTFFWGAFRTVKICLLFSPVEETNKMSLWGIFLLVEHSSAPLPNPLVSLACFFFFSILSKASLLS